MIHYECNKKSQGISWTRFDFAFCLSLYKELYNSGGMQHGLEHPDSFTIPTKSQRKKKRSRKEANFQMLEDSDDAPNDE